MISRTVVLPLPSVGCAQNARVHHLERGKHNKHDRNCACRIATESGLRREWSPEGTFALSIEINVVTELQRLTALGLKGKALRDRVLLARKRTFSGYRPDDVQNGIGAAKAFIDGLVDAGLLKDDSRRYLVEVTGRIVVDPSRDAGTTLILTRLEEVAS